MLNNKKWMEMFYVSNPITVLNIVYNKPSFHSILYEGNALS